MSVSGLLRDIEDVGRDTTRGGYSRFVFDSSEMALREWFTAEASRRSLEVEVDRNGALWAWRPGSSMTDAVVTGSHLDSVPGGGAFDGPLGIASSFAALDLLDARGFAARRPLAIVAFPEEEGARFGVACLGSRLMTGAISPEKALNLRDSEGTTFGEAAVRAGLDASLIGADHERLRRTAAFVELHVEQGRGLADLDQPVAMASSILGHGRWRLSVTGEGNHAGSTLMRDRRDPMVAAAGIVVAVQEIARRFDGARATVGRLVPVPGGTNVIASRVDLWLDARHPDDAVTAAVVREIGDRAAEIALGQGCHVTLTEESYGGTVHFDARLRDRVGAVLPQAPLLATGAGHDAGALASHVPTAMLFTRNPTGVSHSPEEFVEAADAEEGAVALAAVLEDLLGSDA
ncbi:allantoate amidohydrolase [Kineosporia succinea]|uniref:N-carbamoyl-L-amino-acid hydrolase n=1 Tax=Kineosporia succinea TaxID=84632 RepID=A0ABT9PE67_9ACTN|nr:allantoate amidohydrolase [Kineosporia succinea]MDP9831009.1 N-carbamoyl-L-amino-acid hydrolase [Kineosporia succinea]